MFIFARVKYHLVKLIQVSCLQVLVALLTKTEVVIPFKLVHLHNLFQTWIDGWHIFQKMEPLKPSTVVFAFELHIDFA